MVKGLTTHFSALGGNNMKQQFLETGEIVNTHGIRGEMKLLPWADSIS